MAVQSASLEVLEKAAVPAAQARAIVQAIEIEIAGAKDTLATRQDMLILRHEMAELRTELRQEMSELRTELRQEMGELRTAR
jgi:ribosome-interacting GTPase 1